MRIIGRLSTEISDFGFRISNFPPIHRNNGTLGPHFFSKAVKVFVAQASRLRVQPGRLQHKSPTAFSRAARGMSQHALPERSHPPHCWPGMPSRIGGSISNNATNGTSAARDPFAGERPAPKIPPASKDRGGVIGGNPKFEIRNLLFYFFVHSGNRPGVHGAPAASSCCSKTSRAAERTLSICAPVRGGRSPACRSYSRRTSLRVSL